MATFSLPATKRLPGFDPNVFPKKEGFDYAARADEAWREIEENIAAMEAVEARHRRVVARSVKGMDWLDTNAGHTRWDEAYRTVRELDSEITAILINLRSLDRAIWHEVCTLYACLYHTDRAAWIARHGVTFDGLSPEGIWDAVMPGRQQPGSWPEGKEEKYIERKVTYVGWQSRQESGR